MSAWLVSPRHIDFMVEAVRALGIEQVENPSGTGSQPIKIGDMSNTDLGRMLMWENVRSVSTRYPYDTFESLPGPIDKKRIVPYRYRKSGLPFNTLAVLKAAACYDYQSCEHDYWLLSTSYAVNTALEEGAKAVLPFRFRRVVSAGYRGEDVMFYINSQEFNALPWGIDEDTEFERMEPADPKVDAIVEAEAHIRRIV